jgi:vitamin B12 transporter
MAVTPLRGQDTTAVEPQQMEPVVVSATRTETPLNQLGQSVTVVTRQQIEETRATDLGDLLRQVVGLDVRTNGQHSSSTAIGIRGLSGYHTKVLINGIVLQDSSSPQQMPILNDINLNDVERIEVVRGPGSTTYGANALGGVVNIITRSGQGAGRTCPDGTPNPLPTGNLGFEFGSHGRFRTSASARGQSGPVDYAVGWLRESEKGISAMDTELNEDNDAWRNQQVQGTLGLRLAPGLRLEVFGRYSSSDEEYDMGYPASMYSPATLDTGDTHNQRWQSGLRLAATDLFDGLLDSSVSASVADLSRGYRDADGWSYNDRFQGRTNQYTWQNTVHLHERLALTLGLDHTQESARIEDGGVPAWYIAPSTPIDDRHRTTALFSEIKAEPIDNLFLNAGARWNDHSVFGNTWTWTSAAAYHIPSTRTRLKVSAGEAYRAPSLYELYEPQYGNSSLRPETGTSWDGGFEQDLVGERLTFGSTYFRNRVNDYIGFDMASWKYDQISGIKANGLESFVRYRPIQDVTLQLTHTYQHTNDMEKDVAALALRPSHKASAAVTWRPRGGKLTVNLNGAYVDEQHTLSGGGDLLDAYVLANAVVSYRFTDYLEVYGRVHNLLNEDYQTAPHYNEYGRVYYAGINVSF